MYIISIVLIKRLFLLYWIITQRYLFVWFIERNKLTTNAKMVLKISKHEVSLILVHNHLSVCRCLFVLSCMCVCVLVPAHTHTHIHRNAHIHTQVMTFTCCILHLLICLILYSYVSPLVRNCYDIYHHNMDMVGTGGVHCH